MGGHPLGPLPGLDPDARHVGNDLAVPVVPYSSTGTVPQVLGTGHGAGHSRYVQYALAAHPAIKYASLTDSFGENQERLHPTSRLQPLTKRTKQLTGSSIR